MTTVQLNTTTRKVEVFSSARDERARADIADLKARTIIGGGLATGGGDLTADRVIMVAKATGAEVVTGLDDGKAVTPLAAKSGFDLKANEATSVRTVTGRSALKALSTSAHGLAFLHEAGREGEFVWGAADFSTEVAADTAESTYVPPDSDATGASGAWVRRRKGPIIATEAGLSVDNDGATNATAWDNLVDYLSLAGINGGEVLIPEGTFNVAASSGFTGFAVISNMHIRGMGRGLTNLFLANGADARVFEAIDSSSYFSIGQLTIDGNRANQTAGVHCISAGDVSNFALYEMEIKNGFGYNIGCQSGDIQDGLFYDLWLSNPGADQIDIKNENDANRGLVFDRIWMTGTDAGGNSGKAGIDLRGPATLSNIWHFGALTSQTSAVRFRNGEGPGQLGARRSSLVNFYVDASADTANGNGLTIAHDDVHLANGTIIGARNGLSVSVDAPRLRASGITCIGQGVFGVATSADDGKYYGLEIKDSLAEGIRLTDADNNEFYGLLATGAATYNVRFTGTSADNKFFGGEASGAGTANVTNASSQFFFEFEGQDNNDLAVADGGTGASTAADARTNLDVPGLSTTNTFAADQTIQSTDAGAGFAPRLSLDRDSASPAAADQIGLITFDGRDSSGASVIYGVMLGEIVDPTNGSEDGLLKLSTSVAGTTAARLVIEHGLYTSGATGGDQGADTINASGYYVDGSAGADGSFTTSDGKTVTVTKGIITAIV